MSDALIAGLSGVAANAPGRAPGQGATVLGGQGQTDEDKWNELDAKVNEYPMLRSFKAIGTGGDAFASAMARKAEGTAASNTPWRPSVVVASDQWCSRRHRYRKPGSWPSSRACT